MHSTCSLHRSVVDTAISHAKSCRWADLECQTFPPITETSTPSHCSKLVIGRFNCVVKNMAAPTREACLSEECLLILCDIFNITELYQHQKVAIKSTVLRREDSIICVPTGGGKSLCFEGSVPCWQYLHSSRPAAVTVSDTDSYSGSTAALTFQQAPST